MSEVGGHLSLQDDEDRRQIQDSAVNKDDGDKHQIAPDTFDEKYQTTKWEIWAYYAYYIGNNRLSLFNFAPTAFQNLLNQAAGAKQSLIYLIGYFLLGDSLNTTVTVIAILQNSVVAYNTLQLTYLLIVGIAAQQRYRLGTKTMFNAIAVGIILLDGWGMIGIWTQRFGFHHVWEVWLYQAFYGLFVCPWYSYSQIMTSEVTPRGHEFLFFSLFSIIGKTSSFIAPIVSSAIIDATPSGNVSTPFYFLFALSVVSFGVFFFGVDLGKSRTEQERFLVQKVRELQSGSSTDVEDTA